MPTRKQLMDSWKASHVLGLGDSMYHTRDPTLTGEDNCVRDIPSIEYDKSSLPLDFSIKNYDKHTGKQHVKFSGEPVISYNYLTQTQEIKFTRK